MYTLKVTVKLFKIVNVCFVFRMLKVKLQQLQAEPISRDIGNIIIRVGGR